ncbi:MAG: sugar phosphate nucleotidyltransferase [Chloroflexota bacterium]
MDHTYAVIMAGGSGTRLWPKSRKRQPKHILPLFNDRTLFHLTIDRLEGLVTYDHILVVTTREQVDQLRLLVPKIPAGNFLVEPVPRGTASVVGLAAMVLQRQDPEAVMMVLPADHFIQDRELFHLVMRVAVGIAQNKFLVTLGISPTFPSTGYGYIERGELLQGQYDFPVYLVKKFKEKPDLEQARLLFDQGEHSWNSGMFIWRVDRILDEFARQMPDLKSSLDRIGLAWDSVEHEKTLNETWQTITPETIDYGIMEGAENVAILPASGLGWSDVGSWDVLFDVLKPDSEGNLLVNSNPLLIDTHNSLIYGNQDGRLIATIGIEGLIIVDAGDALLICHKDQAQHVRRIIELLKNTDRNIYL